VLGHSRKQHVGPQRFRESFDHAQVRAVGPVVDRAEKEDRHPRDRGVGPQRGDELQAGHARHVVVAEDEVGRRLENRVSGSDAVFGQPHRVAGGAQMKRRQLADVCVVVDDQDARSHGTRKSLPTDRRMSSAIFHSRRVNRCQCRVTACTTCIVCHVARIESRGFE
jgi:hypothetical protein